jgi:hypothetical protein
MFSIIDGRTFKGKDTHTYVLEEFTIETWRKYVNWLQFKDYRAVVNADLSKDVLENILQQCLEANLTLTSEEVRFSFGDYLNFEKLLELSCKDFIGKNFNTVVGMENAATIQKLIITLNLGVSDTTEENPMNPNQ